MDIAGNKYEDLALFQPLINGIGGNLVSVQASRIATQMHRECEKKILPNNGRVCQAPWSVFTKGRLLQITFTADLNLVEAE